MQAVQSGSKSTAFLIAIHMFNLFLTIALLLHDRWFTQTWEFTSSSKTFSGGLLVSNSNIIGICRKSSLYSSCYSQCQQFTKKHSIDKGTCDRYRNWNIAGHILAIFLIIGTCFMMLCILALVVQLTNWKCKRIRRVSLRIIGYLSTLAAVLYFIGFGMWAIEVGLTMGKCEKYYVYKGIENVCAGESAIIMMFTLAFMLFTTPICLTLSRNSDKLTGGSIELKKVFNQT